MYLFLGPSLEKPEGGDPVLGLPGVPEFSANDPGNGVAESVNRSQKKIPENIFGWGKKGEMGGGGRIFSISQFPNFGMKIGDRAP